MEVAPSCTLFTLLTLFTLFILFKLLNPISPRGRQICPHRVQTRIPVKNQWVEILIIFVYS